MKKYIFKPYSKIFPELFKKEKARITSHINTALIIEHIGSTAIPNLGGKGIIDIGIAVKKEEMESVSHQLQSLGYELRPNWSTSDRFYFKSHFPDPEEGTREYHLHLTYPEHKEWEDFLFFRDYLKSHPQETKEYEALKKAASTETDVDGKLYRQLKEPLVQKVLSKKS